MISFSLKVSPSAQPGRGLHLEIEADTATVQRLISLLLGPPPATGARAPAVRSQPKNTGKARAKGGEAWASGAYTVAVTGQSEQEIRGLVANGDGREYGVVRLEEFNPLLILLSCPHAMLSVKSIVRPLHGGG